MTIQVGSGELIISANTSQLAASGKEIEAALVQPLEATGEQLSQIAVLIGSGVDQLEAFAAVMGQTVTEGDAAEIAFRGLADSIGLSKDQADQLVPSIREVATEAAAASTSVQGASLAGADAMQFLGTTARLTGVEIAGLHGGVTALRGALNLLKGHPVIAGLTLIVTASTAIFGAMQRAKAEARELGAALAQIQTQSDLGGFTETRRQLEAAFGPDRVRQLQAAGFSMHEIALNADELARAQQFLTETIRQEAEALEESEIRRGRHFLAGEQEIERINQRIAAADEERLKIAEVVADQAWLATQIESDQQKIQREFLETHGVNQEVFAGIVAEWQAVSDAGTALEGNLTSAFTGFVNLLQGVGDQVSITAQELARNSQEILGEGATLMENYAEAIERGLPEVAQAILDAGPTANDAFGELLDNPELAAETERNLAAYADLVRQNVDAHVNDFISSEARSVFNQSARQLGVEGYQGLIEGLNQAHPQVRALIQAQQQDLINAMRREWQAESPSRVTADLGGDAMAGLANGLRNGTQDAVRAAREANQAIIDAYTRSLSRSRVRVAAAAKQALVDPIQEAFDLLSSQLSARESQLNLRDATENLADLRAELNSMPQAMGDLVRAIEEAERASLEVTAAEQVAIERAQSNLDRLLRTREAVTAAQDRVAEAEEGVLRAQQFGDRWAEHAYRDELERARRALTLAEERQASEAEIQLARERLTKAEEDSVGPTRELIDLQRQLERMQERRPELIREIERAELGLLRTQLAALQALKKAQDSLKSGSNLNITSVLGDLATGLGMSKAEFEAFWKSIMNALPKFAGGGFLPRGQAGIVGERGPEVIVGGAAGTSVHPILAGGISIQVDVYGDVSRESARSTGYEIGAGILDKLADARVVS